MTNQQIAEKLTELLAEVTVMSAGEVPVSEEAPKPSKAEKKAANKARFKALNGAVISAGQAFSKGNTEKAQARLSEAFTLASEPTVWVAQQARVLRKCEEFGFPVKDSVKESVGV
tara:strand:+ start:1425 stop:1769 length:345 start_codon:yes stop_codon:yes gene_type:complete